MASELPASFTSPQDQRRWVENLLKTEFNGHKLARQLYQAVVFPVLWEGFQQADPWALEWLARTMANLRSEPALHAQIGGLSSFELKQQAYRIRPQETLRRELLDELVRWLELCFHEAPYVLYGINGATEAECSVLLDELAFARALDPDQKHQVFFDQGQSLVLAYQVRLKNRNQ